MLFLADERCCYEAKETVEVARFSNLLCRLKLASKKMTQSKWNMDLNFTFAKQWLNGIEGKSADSIDFSSSHTEGREFESSPIQNMIFHRT